jgi:hypothetical protein
MRKVLMRSNKKLIKKNEKASQGYRRLESLIGEQSCK